MAPASSTSITSETKIRTLAQRAIAANARHSALPDTAEDAARAALEEWQSALATLAGLPAMTLGELKDKGAALASCLTLREGEVACVEGDAGLAASLLADLAAVKA